MFKMNKSKILQSKRLVPGIVISILILLIIMVMVERTNPEAKITNLFNAIWYAIVTIATVGYGDYYPVTIAGKIIGAILVLFTIGFMGFIIGKITTKINEYMENEKMGMFGTEFLNHVVMIGWDKFSRQVLDQIIHTDVKIAIVTNNKSDIDLIHSVYSKDRVFVLYSEYDNIKNLDKVNFRKASSCFINLAEDMDALVYVLNVKKLFPKIDYVVSVNNPDLKQTFLNAGVTHTISRNEIAAKLVASYVFEPEVATFTEDVMSTAINEFDYDIQQYYVTKDNIYLDKLYKDAFMDLKSEYNVVLIGISKFRDGVRQLIYNPSKKIIIEEKDYLLVIANGMSKKKIEKAFGVQEGKVFGLE